MPFIAALWAGLVAILPQLLIKALIGVGIGYVVYEGVQALLDEMLLMAQTRINNAGGDVLSLFAYCGIDDAITIIFSAYAVRLTFKGLTAAGALKRFGIMPPAQGG